MDGRTLAAAMTYPGYDLPMPQARYDALAPRVTVALRQAHCTTVPRAAMFLAQIGAETGSLRWSEELASGSAYNGRRDLGNTHPGDGPKYKGRSFIQITGRAHYAAISKWAHSLGYVPTATYFLDHPEALAEDRYAFLGPVWYWTVARPQLNALADAHNIYAGTVAVNGGTNNLSGRTARWNKCLSLGSALLSGTTPSPEGDHDMARIVKDAKTGVRYLLVGSAPPIRVTAQAAAEYAKCYGLGPTFPSVTHAALLDLDNRLRHPKSAIRK